MTELLYRESLWLQAGFICTFFGIATSIWGVTAKNEQKTRWGLLAFMATTLIGIPLYYNGLEIIELMKSSGSSAGQIEQYKLDYTTTLTVYFFQGIAALMIYLIMKSIRRIPRFFIILLFIFAVFVEVYLGWRILQ